MSDTILYAALDEIRAHLGAAKMQRAPSDDKIIAEHIDAAHKVAVLTLREHDAATRALTELRGSTKRTDGYGDPAKGEYNAFLADDGSGMVLD